jgi:hypothetical protein
LLTTGLVVLAILVLAVALPLFERERERREPTHQPATIAQRASKRLREGVSFRTALARSLRAFYRPSRQVIGAILLINLTAVILNRTIHSIKLSDAGPVLAIQTALASVLIAVIVLINEGFRRPGGFSSGNVFLRQSMAFPLLCASVSLLLVALISPITWINVGLTIILGCLTITSVYRLTGSILDRAKHGSAQRAFERESAANASRELFLERAAWLELQSVLSDLPNLTQRFTFSKRSETTAFRAWRTARVADIRVYGLEQLSVLLDDIASTAIAPTGDPSTTPLQVIGAQPSRHAFIAMIGSPVSPDTDLLRVNSRTPLSRSQTAQVERLLQYTIALSDEAPNTEGFEALISDIRRDFTAAIRIGSYDDAREASRRMASLVEEYLRFASNIGATMSGEEAHREAALLTGQLPIADEAPRACFQIIRRALTGRDPDILGLALELPLTIARMGARYADQLVVRSFLVNLTALADYYYKPGAVRREYRDIVFARISRGLRDIAITSLRALDDRSAPAIDVAAASESALSLLEFYNQIVSVVLRRGTARELKQVLEVRRHIVPDDLADELQTAAE